jgi:hypothetical protein
VNAALARLLNNKPRTTIACERDQERIMTEQLNQLWTRRVTFTVRDCVLVIATFAAYGALLFGTSEVVSKPAYLQAEWHAEALPQLVTRKPQPVWNEWSARPDALRNLAH